LPRRSSWKGRLLAETGFPRRLSSPIFRTPCTALSLLPSERRWQPAGALPTPVGGGTVNSMICIYKVDNIRAHGTNPLTSPLDTSPWLFPLCLATLPCSQVPLTYLESLLCVWCDPRPLWSQVACKLTPPPLSLPTPFSRPQRFPIPIMCPSTTASRHRLHIVRYTLYWKSFK
jgi:hypothetical protein